MVGLTFSKTIKTTDFRWKCSLGGLSLVCFEAKMIKFASSICFNFLSSLPTVQYLCSQKTLLGCKTKVCNNFFKVHKFLSELIFSDHSNQLSFFSKHISVPIQSSKVICNLFNNRQHQPSFNISVISRGRSFEPVSCNDWKNLRRYEWSLRKYIKRTMNAKWKGDANL